MIADLYWITDKKTNIRKLVKISSKISTIRRIKYMKIHNDVEFFRRINYGSYLELIQIKKYYTECFL